MNKPIKHFSIEHLSKLAKLKISPEKQEIFSEHIDKIIDYVDRISEVKVTKKFKTHTELRSVMREDVVENSLEVKEALSGRKGKTENDYFTIKAVINK